MSSSTFQPPELSELQTLLPSFGIEEFIAAGGMGAVYRARQLSLDREVAIKILPGEFVSDHELREQFSEEARAMAKLNHANLIGIYDFGEVQGMPYLVMEYVSGKSLHDAFHGVAVDPEVAVSIATAIAQGLAHAHEAGIIHRDIKPANILLNKDAQPKIGDFGLARHTGSTAADAMIFGTPGYTAPEVMSNPELVGMQADVFSVGVILYELLTGTLPSEPFIPASRKARTHPQLDRVIKRAIHPDPSQRYPDAASLAADLKEVAPLLKKATLLTGASPVGAPAPRTRPLETGRGPVLTGPMPTASVPPVLSSSGGGNWHFLRNLVIIALLLGAIFGVWKAIEHKQRVTAQRELEHEQQAGKKQEPDKPDAGATSGSGPGQPVDLEPPEPVKKTPLEQLAELQPQLRAGDRSELPEGTLTQGSQAYFVVTTELTWAEAAEFAEEHGGHLAICEDNSLNATLSARLPRDSNAWLGGGLIAPDRWGWVDGNAWSGRELSSKLGSVIALSDLGTIRALPASSRLPFVLQWDLGGKNPGTLAQQLTRMRETAESPHPVWPVGSLHREGRHYLLVPRPVRLEKAQSLAREMDGHLAVPSDPIENDFLLESAPELLAPDETCWLGGRFEDGAWQWLTGEKWSLEKWSDGSPGPSPEAGTGVCLSGGSDHGWVAVGPTKRRPMGFLVEWSLDHTAAAEIPVGQDFEPTPELRRLRGIAMDAYRKHKSQYESDLKQNRKDFLWDLDFWFNGLSGNNREVFGPGLKIFKARFEKPLPYKPLEVDFNLDEIPPEVRGILEKRLKKQDDIEAAYLGRLDTLRQAYLSQLTKKAEEYAASGDEKEVLAFRGEGQALGDDGASLRDYFEELE